MTTGARREDSRRVEPGPLIGVVAGALAVLGFATLHELLITAIWFSLIPMLVAGALCGLCLAWSYGTTPARRTAARWYGYNATYIVVMLGLGAASLIVLEPRFTMAELVVADDPLGDLLPPTVPLLLVGPLVGAAGTWAIFGRNRGSLVPILVTHYLIGFLLGHNFAAFGVVVWSAALVPLAAEFLALSIGLGVGYPVAAHLLVLVRGRAFGRACSVERPAA